MSSGWIYVLDPNMTVNGKAVVKVGYTTRTVEARAKELGTGIPGGLSIAYKLRVDNARHVERQIHRILNSRRVSQGPGREFFALSATEAIDTIEKIALNISSERVDKARREELYQFEKSLGIPRREFAAVTAATLFVITFGYQLTQMSGWQFNVGSAIALAIAVYLIGRGAKAIHGFLYERLVERPFGEQVRAKARELQRKYPYPVFPASRPRTGWPPRPRDVDRLR